ncbi:30S ribosomal protein S15 [Fuerstiella marisgermanici]|uniref:Small ribosomal subunit protein uS15 n=1 Tax=Fuerstiella marisgermanici TaxID=1891926 RepID=A0A1P8WDF5_9PLAN|nr:30S ribosomal protein S15 [Fuerstiella marisgermanici]APZ92090.1 30S ribosomal protein S15 [Fuerstiella marisgermanici]
MPIARDVKQQLRKEFGQSDNDTGSPQIQIACLTHQINVLTEHLRDNQKDHSSRRGLLRMVSRRRRLLDYLKHNVPDQYLEMLSRLSIRK